jgi:N-acyl amino acid synthase of PEP-CTERM/exosortase system
MLRRVAYNHLLIKIFNDNFRVVVADTDELKRTSYRLRYKVFCLERQFDFANNGSEEFDEYDDHSLAFLIQHTSGVYVGTGRLILPNEHDLLSSFPIVKYLPSETTNAHGLNDPAVIRSTCEISRLGILREYTNPTNELYESCRGVSKSFRRHLTDLCKLGLYRGIFSCALDIANTPNCVFTTDPFILRRFERVGFRDFSVMGDSINIFGAVIPVKFNIYRMLEECAITHPHNWAVVTDNGRLVEAHGKKKAVRNQQSVSCGS